MPILSSEFLFQKRRSLGMIQLPSFFYAPVTLRLRISHGVVQGIMKCHHRIRVVSSEVRLRLDNLPFENSHFILVPLHYCDLFERIPSLNCSRMPSETLAPGRS
jgi:hypothetical protein